MAPLISLFSSLSIFIYEYIPIISLSLLSPYGGSSQALAMWLADSDQDHGATGPVFSCGNGSAMRQIAFSQKSTYAVVASQAAPISSDTFLAFPLSFFSLLLNFVFD